VSAVDRGHQPPLRSDACGGYRDGRRRCDVMGACAALGLPAGRQSLISSSGAYHVARGTLLVVERCGGPRRRPLCPARRSPSGRCPRGRRIRPKRAAATRRVAGRPVSASRGRASRRGRSIQNEEAARTAQDGRIEPSRGRDGRSKCLTTPVTMDPKRSETVKVRA